MINIICCVCKKKYNEIKENNNRSVESHGYCDECFPETMKDIKNQFNKKKELKPGQPCNHPGCCSHISHPCEGCGRTGCH